jgi:Raf kinase inhibitor-like YbhB/YbcL family protein
MKLSSSSIESGRIAKPHACRAKGGSDQPLQLTLSDIPGEARYLAIVADDPDAVRPAGKVWVHWNVFNVPVAGPRMEIAPGQSLSGEVGSTSGKARGYEGMCPPDGVHTYRFAVFALRDPVKVDTGKAWTLDDFEAEFGSQLVGKALVTGQF